MVPIGGKRGGRMPCAGFSRAPVTCSTWPFGLGRSLNHDQELKPRGSREAGMEADQAVKFIERMFSHAAADRMAILAIPRSEGKAEQRVFTLGQATSRKVQGWLRHLNARDYDIYLCVNPVRAGIRGQGEGRYRRDPPAAAGPGRGGSRGPGPGLRGREQGRRCRGRPTC